MLTWSVNGANFDMASEHNEMEETDWSQLPSDVIVHILSFLPPSDRAAAARINKFWNEAFQHPRLWQYNVFKFTEPRKDPLVWVQKFGKFMKSIVVVVDQMCSVYRENACALLQLFAIIDSRRLTSFKLVFCANNPLFYSGQEFLDSLTILFSRPPENIAQPIAWLQHVDLSEIDVPYDDLVINTLSLNHPTLQYLDIQNRVIVCKVTSFCILSLVQRCRKLKDLRVYHCSISDEILLELASVGSLQHLSIICRRDEKYGTDLSAEVWAKLRMCLPKLKVTLGFDHTCPFDVIPVIMKPEIPVTTLKLEIFADAYEHVNMAAAYYSKSLKKLVLQTRNSAAFEEALLNIARSCPNLTTLLVYCVVRSEVIDEIFRLHPSMKERGTYILKSVLEPEPWIVGVEDGD